jgi:hypothetical protein
MRAGIDEADLRDLKAGCKPRYEHGSADPPQSFNSVAATK